MVIEPVALPTGSVGSATLATNPLQVLPLEVDMGLSGEHLLQSDRNKPIHRKFAPTVGKDGMWLNGTINPTVSGGFLTGWFGGMPMNFLTLSVITGAKVLQTSPTVLYAEVKLRFAWTDTPLL